jgi:hypothetical protein
MFESRKCSGEGGGNRRGGLPVEIGVEDRKVEVRILRRFQRLFDARGFGSDGVAEFAEQTPAGLTSYAHGCHLVDRSAQRYTGNVSPPAPAD